MYTLIVLAVLGLDTKNDTVITAHVDAIELNHYYNQAGDHVLTQWIFWHQVWYKGGYKEVVVAWRMAEGKVYKRDGQWRLVFFDSRGDDHGVLRRVSADSYFETWTQHDPEVADRGKFPPQKRPGIGWRGNPRRGPR